MKRDDTLWKGILENVFDDFLRFFFPDADKLFDMEKGFEFLDKELEQLFPTENGESPKFVDKLVKVYTKTGKEQCILVHIEVQGYDDKGFAKRMFTYFYRILDKYGIPITAIAIFTDANLNFRPNVYEYEYLGTKNSFHFNTYKIIDQREELLTNSDNPFAIVVLTVLLALKKKKMDDAGLFELKYSLAKELLQRQFSKNKINNLMVFLQLYVKFADPEYNHKFEQALEVLTENKTTMGIQEMVLERAKKEGLKRGMEEGLEKGMEQGMEQGMERGIKKGLEKGLEEGLEKKGYEVVKNLLESNRFTIEEVANFANVTEEFVLKVKSGLK